MRWVKELFELLVDTLALENLKDDVLVKPATKESVAAAVASRKDIHSRVHRTMHLKVDTIQKMVLTRIHILHAWPNSCQVVSDITLTRLEERCAAAIRPLLEQISTAYADQLSFDKELGQVK